MAVIAAGVVTGLLAGLFGIGGGAVIVPVIYEVFRILDVPEAVRMQLCVGTSLAIIVPTAVRSYRAHLARGLVIPAVLRAWALPAVAGVAVGSAAAAVAPGSLFKAAFVLVAGVIAAKLLAGREDWVLSDRLPGPLGMTGWGFLVGLASSLMGISGGSLATMALTLYGKPIHNAVATSAGLGVPITIAGALGYVLAGLPHQPELPPLAIGFVSVIGVVVIAPISSYVAPLGARLAHALARRSLEIGFGLFLLVASARFVVSLLAPTD
ncbi:MAG TPA: sulfite exporter TauE/SafE family protein [Stellaceae bacterium]|nr:sulfite exporter TauE/SafE family protein [Stellaceae bacterium]